jgi:hypothetical protein
MLHLRRDPTGELARLQCDDCGRESGVFLCGPMRSFPVIDGVRRQLREWCHSCGWELYLADEGGRYIDLCRKCYRRKRRSPRP